MREMKDSGVEWIGAIPVSWSTIKNKYIFRLRSGEAISKEALIDEGLYPVYGGGERIGYYNKYNVSSNSFLIGRVGARCGCVTPVNSLCWATDNALIAEIDDMNDYYTYALIAANLNRLNESNAQPLITATKVLNVSIPKPDKKEQLFIAEFLNNRSNECDTLIIDIQSQIETLEEYKKSLVFRVVSKGLKKESLKTTTSDVWTSIPENWRLVDIKYVFEIVKRIAGQEGFDVLSVTQRGLKVKDVESNNGQQAESYAGYQFVYPTDYVMNHMDLLTGWVDCSTMFGVTSPDYRVFRLRDKENNDLTYFKYLMQCCYMSRIFYSLGQGVSNLGRWRLQTSAFNNFMIPVPPLEEQREIADYLDTKISEIDIIIADKQKQIETIEEYKKSLIFEYVTGKKEVQA